MDKIHNIDCLEFMKGIKDNSYDVVITSPPYNIGRNYNLYNDNRSDYIEWQKQVFNEVCRVLKSNGHLFLNIASTKNDPFAPYKIAEKLNWKFWSYINKKGNIQVDTFKNISIIFEK